MNRSLITYLLIVGIAGTVGVATGILGKNLLGGEQVIYKGDPEQYQDDAASLLEKYKKNPNINNYSPSNLVNIGLEKYRNCENCYSVGIGLADTVVKQTIRNFQIKNGDKYFEESISKSDLVGVANRAIQTGKDGTIKLYKSKPKSATTASYPEESDKDKQWSKDEYKKYLGKTLDRMFIYLLSDTSTLEGSKTTKLSNGDIEVVLNLHPDISTYYYKIQMKNISGLDALPSFEYLKHTYTFSKDMDLKSCFVDEKYNASMGISVTIRNTITYTYYPNEYYEIPKNDTSLNYSITEENA